MIDEENHITGHFKSDARSAEDYEKRGYQTVVILGGLMDDRRLDYVIHALMQHNATHCGNFADLRFAYTADEELMIVGKPKPQ